MLLSNLVKWKTDNKEASFHGTDDVAKLRRWNATLISFFLAWQVKNEMLKAHLAVTTFRRNAEQWWHLHAALQPELEETYDQLLE